MGFRIQGKGFAYRQAPVGVANLYEASSEKSWSFWGGTCDTLEWAPKEDDDLA